MRKLKAVKQDEVKHQQQLTTVSTRPVQLNRMIIFRH